MMKQGQIKCECGNIFYFQSIREKIPCMKCGRTHQNNGNPIPIEEEIIKDE